MPETQLSQLKPLIAVALTSDTTPSATSQKKSFDAIGRHDVDLRQRRSKNDFQATTTEAER